MICNSSTSALVSGFLALTLLTACLIALARLTSRTVSACDGVTMVGIRVKPLFRGGVEVDFMKNEKKATNNLHLKFAIVIIPLELEPAL